MVATVLFDAERNGGAHPLRHWADPAQRVQDRAVRFGYPREGELEPGVRQTLAGFGLLQQDIGHGVVNMGLEQGRLVAPFRDHPKLRVIFEVGWLLSLEVPDTQRRK